MNVKILVYGAGVIGCYLSHVLCAAGNDVTLLARGVWGETLERNGLTIVHHLQKKTTHDRPQIISAPDGGTYDLVFAVMQYKQIANILEELAGIGSQLVVLVGNNMAAPEMERIIQSHTSSPKTVLFGFQGTGGRREDGKVVCVRWGAGSMSLGAAGSQLSEDVKMDILKAFQGTGYRLTWVPDMDAWYKCHLAFILPVCYLSYALGCDLRCASGRQIRRIISACREGYELLSACGCPILPEGSKEELEGVKGRAFYVMMRIIARTAIGRLAATDHCRHAVAEMEALDRDFAALRDQLPDFSMPNWDALRADMPDWRSLHRQYDGNQ